MPELPEVETICHDISASILKQKITSVVIRNFKLRYPISKTLPKILTGQKIEKVSRLGKYILLKTKTGALIIHLGMSGNLQIKPRDHDLAKHEHVNIILANNLSLCYHDPRRFGAILWTTKDSLKHKLLQNLGPDPLHITANHLFERAKSRRLPIKQFIMNNQIITGIGNIYASEILFAAKIDPLQKANSISLNQCKKLIKEAKRILKLAIKHRGTTISDHKDGKGKEGSFQNKLKVYGKEKIPCGKCRTKLKLIKIAGRSTFFCPSCQAT